MKMQTTYVNRANTNATVYERASAELKERQALYSFGDTYMQKRQTLLGHTLRLSDNELEKYTTVHQNIPLPWKNPITRHGQPRTDWTVDTMKEVWDMFKETLGEPDVDFNQGDVGQIQTINMLAHIRAF